MAEIYDHCTAIVLLVQNHLLCLVVIGFSVFHRAFYVFCLGLKHIYILPGFAASVFSPVGMSCLSHGVKQKLSLVGAICVSVLTGVDKHIALTGLRLVWRYVRL